MKSSRDATDSGAIPIHLIRFIRVLLMFDFFIFGINEYLVQDDHLSTTLVLLLYHNWPQDQPVADLVAHYVGHLQATFTDHFV